MMQTFEIIAELLLVGMRMWEHHEKEKYVKLVLEIKRKRYEEEGKPVNDRDQAMLDHFDHELQLISEKFLSSTQIRRQDAAPKP